MPPPDATAGERVRDSEVELLRHALGLNRQPVSFRKHFVAGPGHEDYAAWVAMAERGDAVRHDGKRMAFGGDDLFIVTRQGAEKALRSGERLCPEDFRITTDMVRQARAAGVPVVEVGDG